MTNTPHDYLMELNHSYHYDLKEEIMANKYVPEDLFKDYYTIKYNNVCKAFIRNIHISQNCIQFIIDKILKRELPSINANYKSDCIFLFTVWSINNLIDCENITQEQLETIKYFMENEYNFKQERDYKDCLTKIERKINERKKL